MVENHRSFSLEKNASIPFYDEDLSQALESTHLAVGALDRKINQYFDEELYRAEVFYKDLIEDLDKKGVLYYSKESLLDVKSPALVKASDSRIKR